GCPSSGDGARLAPTRRTSAGAPRPSEATPTTWEFRTGLARLLALAAARPTAILCAEAVPWRCHRQLIADALVVRGHPVVHVTGLGQPSPHRLTTFARLDGERVVYDAGQLPMGTRQARVPPGRPEPDRP